MAGPVVVPGQYSGSFSSNSGRLVGDSGMLNAPQIPAGQPTLMQSRSVSQGFTFTLTINDSMGVTDGSPVDSVVGVGNGDPVGLTDSVTVTTFSAFTATVDDSAGVTDSRAISWSPAITDSAGLQNGGQPISWSPVSTDSTGLTDSTTVSSLHLFSVQVDDSAGLTDARAVAWSPALTDSAGSTDTASFAWSPAKIRGVNSSGGEFGALPGVYGTDYHYDSASSLSFLYARGYRTVRLPFLWERIQPTLGAALDSTELGRLTTFVSNAASAGLGVVLDLHNFGGYNGNKIGATSGPTSSQFADVWTRLATAFKNTSAVVGYSIMNEPNGLGTVQAGNLVDTTYSLWVPDDSNCTVTGTTFGADNVVKMTRANTNTFLNANAPVFNVTVGTTYTISADFYPTFGSSRIRLRIEWQDSGGTPLSSQFSTQPTVSANTWTNLSYTATAPTSAAKAKLTVYSDDTTATGQFSYVRNAYVGVPVPLWQSVSQGAVTAIRAAGDTKAIFVCGDNWSGVADWTANNPTAWISDPAGNLFYEGHHYWDGDHSGTYTNTYATEVTTSVSNGYTAGSYPDALTNRVMTELANFRSWLVANNARGYVGEFGWPRNNGSHTGDFTSWNVLGATWLAAVNSYGLGWAYWSTSEWWGAYTLSLYDTSGGVLATPNEQAPTVEAAAAGGVTLTDGAGLTDSVTISWSPVITDSAGVTDSVSVTFTSAGSFTPTITDPAGLVDIMAISWSPVLTDTTGLTDAGTSKNESGSGTDNAGLTDSVVVTFTPGAGLTRTIADSAGLTDATGAFDVVESFTDSSGLTDSVSVTTAGGTAFTRSVSDTTGLTDTLTVASAFAQAVTDPAGITDAASAASAFAQAVTDPAGLSDAASAASGFARQQDDPAGLTDSTSVSTSSGFTQQVTDPAGLTDSASQVGTFVRQVDDSAGVTDTVSVSTSAGFSANVTDSAGSTDSLALAWSPVASDPVGLADGTTTAVSYVRQVDDSAGLTDAATVATAGAGTRQVDDSAGVTDTASQVGTHVRASSDDSGLTDTAVPASTFPRTASTDSSGLTDSVTVATSRAYVVTVDDPAGLVDASSRVLTLTRQVDDLTGLVDVAGEVAAYLRAVTDSAGTADTAVVTLQTPIMRIYGSSAAVIGGASTAVVTGTVPSATVTGSQGSGSVN